MNHYFIYDPELKAHERLIKYTIFDKEISLITDSGVFSNKAIDKGSLFFIKNCLWAGMGSTRYLNLIPKIQNLFGGRLLVFCCDGRFLLNHSRSICGFFRSIDLRNTGPIVPLIHFESCAPAWPLAFKKSSCCEKVISGFSGRSHPARSGRVLQLP